LDIFKLSNKKDASNLRDRNDLLKSILTKNQMKSVLFSWYTKQEYPITPKQHQMLSLKFRDDLFKKVYNQKRTFLKSIEGVVGSTKLETNNDESVGALTPNEQEQLKLKQAEAMSKYTLVEQVSLVKAEAIVIRDEIDKNILVHGIDIIEKEYAGLSSALNSEASNISAFVHPFQQFSSV